MRTGKTTKFIAIMIAAVMVFNMSFVSVFAEGETDGETPAQEETQQEEQSADEGASEDAASEDASDAGEGSEEDTQDDVSEAPEDTQEETPAEDVNAPAEDAEAASEDEESYDAGEGKYVKDVIIAYGKTEEDAKKWLKDNKWEPIKGDCDFNAGKASFFDNNKIQNQNVVAVMGIRRTDKADEAITDMAVMNMKGGYSFQDYENLLKEKKAEIKEFVNNFQVVIDEFRDNYNGKGSEFGRKRADFSFGVLNQFYDGDPEDRYAVNDTGKKLGDLLVSKTRQEGNESGADLEQLVLESSGPAMLIVESLLVTAADTGKQSWVDRASGLTGDELTKNLEKYVPEAKGQDVAPSAAKQFLKQHFGDTAKSLMNEWSRINELMLWYEDYNEKNDLWQHDGESDEEYDARAEKFFAELGRKDRDRYEDERGRYVTASILYYHLYETPYEGEWGETMGDFFNPAEDSDFASNADNFLPMAAALSPGQKAGLDFVSLQSLLIAGCGSEDGFNQMVPEVKKMFKDKTVMDIYSGVNRGAFRNGVALTSAALMEQNMGRGQAFDALWDNTGIVALTSYAAALTGAITFGLGAALRINGTEIVGAASADDIAAIQRYLKSAQTDYKVYQTEVELGTSKAGQDRFFLNEIARHEKSLKEAQGQKVVNSTGNVGRWFMGIGGAVMVAAAVVKGVQMYKYYKRTMTPIPLMIVDESDIVTYLTDENGNPVTDDSGNQKKSIEFNTFEYYEAVKCNRPDVGEIGDWQDGVKEYKDHGCYDIADLNADMGQEWLALYTVKSPDKGDPILADSLKLQYGSSKMPEGCTENLHFFTLSSPVDLGDMAYAYNNDKNGVYFFWDGDEDAKIQDTASAFSGGYAAIAGGVGLLVGIILTSIVFTVRKKKEETAA